jgi:hypothetical protein
MRGDLDAWFAKADDILTDWPGSGDAMDTASIKKRQLADGGGDASIDTTEYVPADPAVAGLPLLMFP